MNTTALFGLVFVEPIQRHILGGSGKEQRDGSWLMRDAANTRHCVCANKERATQWLKDWCQATIVIEGNVPSSPDLHVVVIGSASPVVPAQKKDMCDAEWLAAKAREYREQTKNNLPDEREKLIQKARACEFVLELMRNRSA